MLDHKLASELLKTAGDIAMKYYRKVTPSFKEDMSMVTEADRAVQDYLAGRFTQRFPSAGLIAEEDHLRKAPAECETSFVIDPIDGTASFVGGTPVWGVAVGVIGRAATGCRLLLHACNRRPLPHDGKWMRVSK